MEWELYRKGPEDSESGKRERREERKKQKKIIEEIGRSCVRSCVNVAKLSVLLQKGEEEKEYLKDPKETEQ